MKIISPKVEILTPINDQDISRHIETCARNCYKSEGYITKDSDKKIITMLIKNGHEAMLEHFNITVKFTNSLHAYKDLTRHRHASFAIESTRWCNYTNDKFGNELTFVKPYGLEEGTELYGLWKEQCLACEKSYLEMKVKGATNDQASDVLNQSLKADVVMTCNLREWRYILKLRTNKDVYPNIRYMLQDLLMHFIIKLPIFFKDLEGQLNDFQPYLEWKKQLKQTLSYIENSIKPTSKELNECLASFDTKANKFLYDCLMDIKEQNPKANIELEVGRDYDYNSLILDIRVTLNNDNIDAYEYLDSLYNKYDFIDRIYFDIK